MFVLPSAYLISIDAIKAVGLFDQRLSGYEDDDLFTRMFSEGYRSIYVNVAATKWRIYGSSTSFSPRMAKSRMIYFKKQLELFPDDPIFGVLWSRDVIGPRFMGPAFGEFRKATKEGRDLSIVESSWAEVQEIAPVLKSRTRRRMRLVAPIVRLLCRNHFRGPARALARYAIR